MDLTGFPFINHLLWGFPIYGTPPNDVSHGTQELGAGCGLASLTAARLGAQVLATDFRQLPLQLLRAAARRQACL